MKGTDKNTRMLILYHQLLTGKKVRKHTFCLEHEITERTFDRDVEDVRLFLSDEFQYCELSYDRLEKSYSLSHTVGKQLSGEEVLLMINSLKSQKCLRNDELYEMFSGLVDVTDSSRRSIIYNFLKEDYKYNRQEGKVAVLKMHWDLSQAIQNRMQITMNYELDIGNYVQRKVNPVELYFEGGYIYLIAFNVEKTHKYPAFYRLDRIHSFRVDGTRYLESIIADYRMRDIHANRYSMLAGEEICVKIQVDHSIERVVNELFPTNKIIFHDSEKSVIEINTYKQGFINWVLGQGEKVIVIEPEELKNEVIIIIKDIIQLYLKE